MVGCAMSPIEGYNTKAQAGIGRASKETAAWFRWGHPGQDLPSYSYMENEEYLQLRGVSIWRHCSTLDSKCWPIVVIFAALKLIRETQIFKKKPAFA
jgi:hypothetical protein